jgi:ornithine carbamoyltransferase
MGRTPDAVTRHLLDADTLTAAEVDEILRLAVLPPVALGRPLAERGAALVFEKPSARTRNSTEMAVVDLGGHPVYIQAAEVGIDTRESAEDVARTLACYHGVICARVMSHGTLVRMAAALEGAGVGVPVVNLLSDLAHPCQAIADVLTVAQVFGTARGRTLAFVGDANNVWRSLAAVGILSGMDMRVAAPEGYGPGPADLAALERLGGSVLVTADPAEAADGADVLYTDVWTSMGQEEEAEARRAAFAGFTVDEALLASARSEAVVLHCLPAHRGDEIAAAVIDGARSRVWQQAANRLPAARAVLAWVLGVPCPVE